MARQGSLADIEEADLARRRKQVSLAGPGYEGTRELVCETVPHPRLAGEVQAVVRNARHDPVEQLYHQRDRSGRRLIGEGERRAGLEIRAMVEALGLDAVRSMALNERVDGGARHYEIGGRRHDAGRRIRALAWALGRDQFDIVVRVAGYGETITLVACDYEDGGDGRANGACSKGTRDAVGWLFRRALRNAAEHLGYGPAHGPARGRMVSWAGEGE